MIEFHEFVFRVMFAGICGLVVGLDREIKGKPLGVRAYVLVAVGSSALMAVTLSFALSGTAQDPAMSVDPTRLIQGLVGGIGFLGAGAIMSSDGYGRLRGVGSGAAVWAVGSIGVACGLGYYAKAAFVSFLIFAVLNLFDRLDPRRNRNRDAGPDRSPDRS